MGARSPSGDCAEIQRRGARNQRNTFEAQIDQREADQQHDGDEHVMIDVRKPIRNGRRLVEDFSSIKKPMSLLTQYLRTIGFAVTGGSGAFGVIAKVTHVDQPSGRFSTARSLYPLMLR